MNPLAIFGGDDGRPRKRRKAKRAASPATPEATAASAAPQRRLRGLSDADIAAIARGEVFAVEHHDGSGATLHPWQERLTVAFRMRALDVLIVGEAALLGDHGLRRVIEQCARGVRVVDEDAA